MRSNFTVCSDKTEPAAPNFMMIAVKAARDKIAKRYLREFLNSEG